MRGLIVEDEKQLGESIESHFKGFADCILLTSSPNNFDYIQFDFFILDIKLGNSYNEGFFLCQHIRKISPAPIIIISSRFSLKDKLKAFDLGANDYLVKPFNIVELVARIKMFLAYRAQSKGTTDTIIETNKLIINKDARIAVYNNRNIKKKKKEFDLLLYLAENSERVLSRENITKEVWDEETDLNSNVVDVYINRLRKSTSKDLIKTVYKVGYALNA